MVAAWRHARPQKAAWGSKSGSPCDAVKDTILIIEDEERLARLLADYVETAGFPTLEQKAKLKQVFEQR